MAGNAFTGHPVCGKIFVTGGRAICPVCHRSLPGRYPPGATASGIILVCKQCRREYQIYTSSDLRPERPASED